MNRRRWQTLVAAGMVALAGLGVTLVPRGLRRLDFFQVRRVEVLGVRHLEGRDVVAAMRLPSGASVFDDPGPFQGRVLAMRGVQRVEVGPRWPGTLVVRVTEWQPVALTPLEGGLAMMDRRGRILPYDPTRAPVDLPVAPADAVVARALSRLLEWSPGLFGRIDGAERIGKDVALRAEGRRILVRGDVSGQDLRALAAVQADLARRGQQYRELDARFTDRVFVRGMTS